MLIEYLITFFINVFDLLTKNVDIPSFPDEVFYSIENAMSYIMNGLGVLDNYIDVSYCLMLFQIYISIEVALNVYYFIMWILKKVPMLGIE